MPKKDKQNEEHSKISMRIGDVQVELEGSSENIKKLMEKELFEFARKLEGTAKQLQSSNENTSSGTSETEIADLKTEVNPPLKIDSKSKKPTKKSGLILDTKNLKLGKKINYWKNLTTALLLICIVLLASLIGVLAFFLPTVNDLNSQIAEKNLSIAELSANITSLNTRVSDLQDTIDQEDSEIADLKESAEYLNALTAQYLSILFLNESSYLVAQEGIVMNTNESTMIFQYRLDYAGYVSVNVESTSNTTYVQLFYAYKGVSYNQNVTVGESGTAYFPVLPAITEIWIGNTETYTSDLVNATVTALYYY